MKSGVRVIVVGGFGSGQLPESYADALGRLGAEVVRFDSDRAYFTAGRWARFRLTRRALRWVYWERVNRSLLEIAAEARPHLVLAIKAPFMEPDTIRALKARHGSLVVNYYPDNPYCGVPWNPRKTSAQRRDLVSVLRHYDQMWIWEPGLAQRLRADGVRAAYLPFAVDDTIFQPITGPATGCPECGSHHLIAFVGQHSDKRAAHVGAIKKHRVSLWGNRWGREARHYEGRHFIHHRSAFGSACARIYNQASICLNIVDDLNMPGHNMRTFEIPGSGGVMLSSYTREQDALLPEGAAAIYYRAPSELDEKIGALLENPGMITRMRCEATSIARSNTYVDRARSILRELELIT